MTNPNLTSINVVIDASGSMGHLAGDTVGSFNSFLQDQKAFPGEALFTLVTFNTEHTTVHDSVKIANVADLTLQTYRPSGGTALLDAVGTTINTVGQRLAALSEEERPSKVLFLIITDGEENSSRRFTANQVKSMVEHQRSTYSWEFVFIGANIDAFSAGTSLGFSGSNSVGYNATKGGTRSLYGAVSANTTSYRSSHSSLAPDFFGQTGQTPTGTVVAPAVPSTPVAPAVTPVTPTTPGTGSGK